MDTTVRKLYTYFRSSSAYRVRIALNYKGLDFESKTLDLVRNGGENWHPGYMAVNPQGLLPTLQEGRRVMTQSMAIIEYLDECHPEPPLMPATPRERAKVRSLAQVIACDIHPLNTQRVLKYLHSELMVSEDELKSWYCHWVEEGLQALESLLDWDKECGDFCHGDQPTLADLCLVPQAYNALYFGCDFFAFPTIKRIYDNCMSLPAFRDTAPEAQTDAA